MLKAVDLVPFYEPYKELIKYSVIKKDFKKALEYAKITLTYNSNCEQTLKILKQYFPEEANFVSNKQTVIRGEYQRSKDYKQLKYHKVYDAGTIERQTPKYI